MQLRSGYEYFYSAPATSSRTATNSRKRKADDDTLNERSLKRQDTSPVLQGEPSSASLPVPHFDKIVGEEFQLLRVLGQGGNACAYVGQRVNDKSYVAVKVFPKPECRGYKQIQQLEIDAQRSLKHANIVPLLRVVQDDDYVYLHMFPQILDAVEYMHANGVYHGDLKLDNIFLKSQGEQDAVCKVGDFGLATRERFILEYIRGTPCYAAPELSDSSKYGLPYDATASDVWSLSIVLLPLLSGGNYPWDEASDNDLSFSKFKRDSSGFLKLLYPNLSAATYRLLQSMLALDGADRPSVSSIKEQFSAINCFYMDDADREANGRTSGVAHL